MNTTELLTLLVAMLGAGAWLPHIMKWYRDRNTISRILIVPDNSVQIGYTSLGPIFNLDLAIATTHKDIIIREITVKITHENGETHNFRWQGLFEKIGEISNLAGDRAFQSRDQTAIALKLVTSSLVERFVRFNEVEFQSMIKTHTSKVVEFSKFAVQNESNKKVHDSKEFYDLMKYFESNFWWKEGNYSVEFNISCFDRFEFEKLAFGFYMPGHEVERLRANLKLIRTFLSNYYSIGADTPTDNLEFHWSNISVVKAG